MKGKDWIVNMIDTYSKNNKRPIVKVSVAEMCFVWVLKQKVTINLVCVVAVLELYNT